MLQPVFTIERSYLVGQRNRLHAKYKTVFHFVKFIHA